MKKFIQMFILLVTFVMSNVAISAPVSVEKAKIVAINFFKTVDGNSSSISLVYTRENAFYVFGNECGWVIVSADDRVIPVIAYSTENPFIVPENQIDTIRGNNFWGMMKNFEDQIKFVADNNISATDNISSQWESLITETTNKSMSTTTVVNPLLTTSWDQNWPYNAMCPSGAAVGCVGVAMGQIMAYHDYPSQGLGSYGYQWGSYPYTGANFGTTNYNFSIMPNSISTMSTPADSAVARLLYQTAVSCRSMWGSSTAVGYSSDQDPMTRAWVNYFKYAFSTIQYVQKMNYTDTEWNTMIQAELNANRPVYYRGDGSLSHAWVCDGVDASSMYHFNWGWGGAYNGYFALTNINPGSNNLTNNQAAIIGIKPNDGSTLVVNTTWSGTITKTTNVAVPDAITLSVNPGAIVSFSQDCKLQVFGRIISIGSSSSYVKLTAIDTITGWLGIKWDNLYLNLEVMADNDTSKLLYTQVEWSKNSGIYCNYYGKVIVDHCKVNNNNGWNGAGICVNNHSVKISYTEIYNNHATNIAGGAYLNCTDNMTVKICQNDIHDNLSVQGGGFAILSYDNLTFEENIVYNNYAGSGAGGSLIGGNPTLVNNKFSNNITSTPGYGCLYLENCSAKIVNNLIINNTAYGIYCKTASPLILNNTISNNSYSYASGIMFVNNSNANVKNCIIYGNYASNPVYGHQIALGQTDCDPYFDHCNIEGGLAGIGGPGAGGNYTTTNYTNNIDSNPLFVAPSAGAGSGYNGLTADWSLQSSSPCVNTGDTTGVSQYLPALDLADNPRINGIIDMGGYEYGCTVPAQPSTITGNTNPCEGSSQIYSVTNISGVTYTWVVPAGSSITSGQGTNTITVTIGANSGNITVTPSNTCGNGLPQNLAIMVNNVPAQPTPISGNTTPCQSSSQVYSVTNVSGITYTWTVPSGSSITTGQGTNTITVTIGANSGNISVVPSNACGNGSSSNLNLTVNPLPGNAGTITGPGNICRGTNGIVYTVPVIANANTYNWTIPSGFTVVSGTGTNSITVDVNNTAVSGNVSVYASNSCGNGQSSTLSVAVHWVDANAGSDQTIQYGTSTTLSGSASNGSGNYTWAWQPTALLINANVQNPTTVNLNSTTVFTLTVSDLQYSCTSTDNVTVSITGGPLSVNAVANPDTICEGNSSQLDALASGGSGTYTYSWTSNPAGFTSTLQNPIVYPTITTTYTVVVNDGFNIVNSSVEVAVNHLATAPNQPIGPDSVDLNVTNVAVYTTNPVNNADYYLWEITPSNAGSLSSGNGTSVTVTWDTGFVGNCSLTVKAVNNCGISPSSVAKNIYVDFLTSVNELEIVSINIFPNPCRERFTISSQKQISEVYLYDLCGKLVNHLSNIADNKASMDCNNLPQGLYFVHVYMGKQSVIQKVIVK